MDISILNEYVIDDLFEEVMLAEQNSFKSESPLLKQIRESQGIVDNYYSIIDEIYAAIQQCIKIPYDPDFSQVTYILNNYTLKQDCFIKNVNVRVLGGKKGHKYHGSYFTRSYENVELSTDFKLLNAKFTIGISENDLTTLSSKNEFFKQMAHELHHAFRYYNICISNNASIRSAEKCSARYGNMINAMINGSDGPQIEKLSPNLYMLNKDEIISEANELYEYIRRHEEIKPSNFVGMLNDLPLFWRITRAAKFIKYLDNILFNERNEEKINEIGNAYIKLMNFNNTAPHKAFLKCRYRVIGMEEYIRNVFFRTIEKAFNDFGRKNEEHSIDLRYYIEKNKDFELLKEILNKR